MIRYHTVKKNLTSAGINPYQMFGVLPSKILKPIVQLYYGDVWSRYNDFKILFIHIPKSAGSSVGLAIYGRPTQHRPASHFFALDEERFSNAVSCSVIRNPYDRFCSIFYHYSGAPLANSDEKQVWKMFFSRFSGPNDFAHALNGSRDIMSYFMSLVHARPQVDWLKAEGKIIVKHLFIFERLSLLENFLQKQLSNPGLCLPYFNRGIRKASWEKELDKCAMKIIRGLYAEDFEVWESLSASFNNF